VPLNRLVAVTGVSGSGKSTLARDVLLANVQAWVQQRSTKAGRDAMDAGKAPSTGRLHGPVRLREHRPRARSGPDAHRQNAAQSCPATYIGFWDTIRKLFAETLEAKARGYAAGRVSASTPARAAAPAAKARACAPSR
jgi:excinuclease ABC subunit A